MRRWLYLCIAVLFIFACGKKIDVNVTPEDLCKLDSRLCRSPSPTPGPSWPPTPQPSPSAIPSPAPSPVPEPSPSPSPLPSPSPVITPEPTECKTPQLTSDSWEIVNWGGDASQWPARESFVGFGDPPGVVLQEIMAVTHCGLKSNPCPTKMNAQAFHAEIARRLRARGFCAGQHEDGVSDMIVVSTNPPLDGLWLEVHQVCGNPGSEIACWGKIDKATTLWRIKGTGTPLPSPEPGESPAPAPSPQPSAPPTPGNSHADIKPRGFTMRPGQHATLTCSGGPEPIADRDAFVYGSGRTRHKVWVNGRKPFETPIPAGKEKGSFANPFCLAYGSDFTVDRNGDSLTVSIKHLQYEDGCDLNISCHLEDFTATSPNAKIEVKP